MGGRGEQHYGVLRAHLRREGRPIGANDMLIAATALSLDLHSAIGALVAAGLVEGLPRGRSMALQVPADVATWLDDFPGALPPAKRRARAA